MFKNNVIIRTLAIIINVFVFINTIGLIIMGIYNTIITASELPPFIFEGHGEVRPGLGFIESIDIFLISLVFLVFSVGINLLFIKHSDQEFIASVPKWMRVKNFSELKFLLMEAIIATLFVLLISAFIQLDGAIDWEFLVLPATVLMLAISLKILKWKEEKD